MNNLLKTIKVYWTEFINSWSLYEIRFQLPDSEYVIIDLRRKFPEYIEYHSLEWGFWYIENESYEITWYTANLTIKKLEEWRKYNYINIDTLNKVIDLIKKMPDFH